MANLQKIKDLAKERDITLDTLASEVGITPQALSKIMRDNSTKVSTLERICHVLSVSPMVFFEGFGSESSDNASSGTSDSVRDKSFYVRNVKDATINDREIVLAALSEIAAQRKLTETAQSQISDLTTAVLNLSRHE